MIGSPETPRSEIFAKLAEIVRDWRVNDRVTTTAGVKPSLLGALGVATEGDLGFDTWRDLVEAAVKAGAVRTERLPTGHVAVLLPDESVDVIPSTSMRVKVQHHPNVVSAVRLRSDVWMAFVDWRQGHRRLFDSSTARAMMYPVDAEGGPAWVTDPGRFAEIEPVSFDMQNEWMVEWASTLQSTDRDPLMASLAPSAGVGAFRRELAHRGLSAAWHAELQIRVVDYVRSWAVEKGVNWNDLIDQRRPRSAGPSAHAFSSLSSPMSRPVRPMGATSESEADKLRAVLHRIIDRMTLAELAALPVRAEHLLGCE